MTKEVLEKLLERTIFVFLSGIVLLLLGATGGISIGTFSIKIFGIGWQVGLSVIGILLIGFGIFLQVRETSESFKSVTISPSISNVLTDWDEAEFVKRLSVAVDVRMIAVANYDLISRISEELKRFIERGGRLRCVYVKPNGSALTMVAMRSIGVETEIEHLRKQYDLTIEALRNIAANTSKKENIQVREIDYLHSTVLTLIDPLLDKGIAYITVNGFGKHFTERPCLIISKAKSPKWFAFFLGTFENTWMSPESSEIMLQ